MEPVVPPAVTADPQPATGEPVTPGEAPPQPDQPEPVAPDIAAKLASAEARIKELNRENEKRRRDAEAADVAAKAEQGKFKELFEAEQKKREAAEAEQAKIARQLLIERIATEHKLPPELRDRLRGDTEEELQADAKELAKYAAQAAKPTAPDIDAQRNGGGRATPGPEAEAAQRAITMRGF